MNNHEYHQHFMEAIKKLAGNPEHKDWCTHWNGGECNCDPNVSIEGVPLHKQKR